MMLRDSYWLTDHLTLYRDVSGKLNYNALFVVKVYTKFIYSFGELYFLLDNKVYRLLCNYYLIGIYNVLKLVMEMTFGDKNGCVNEENFTWANFIVSYISDILPLQNTLFSFIL